MTVLFAHIVLYLVMMTPIAYCQEVDSLKKQAALKLGAETAAVTAAKKRKSVAADMPPPAAVEPAAKKRRKSDKAKQPTVAENKISKMYCICKTPYDESK